MVPWSSIDTNPAHIMMLYIKPVLLNPTNRTKNDFINTVNIHFYSTLNKQVKVNKTLELNSGTTISFDVPYTDLISQTDGLHANIYFEFDNSPSTVFKKVHPLGNVLNSTIFPKFPHTNHRFGSIQFDN